MNILTKLFVGLESLLIILLVPAVVVYVVKSDEFAQQVAQEKATAQRERDLRLVADQQAIAARGERDLRIAEYAARIEGYRSAAESALAREKAAETARADAMAQRDASEQKYTAVQAEVKAWADKIPALEKEKTEIRALMLAAQQAQFKAENRNFELEQAKSGQAATINRLRETIGSLELQLDRLTTGKSLPGQQTTTAGGMSMANLRGVVTARRNIAGIEYATISLGSSDGVVKGMRFRVVDQNSFLGYLTIDAVEPREAVGHLSPRDPAALQSIRNGTDVIGQ